MRKNSRPVIDAAADQNGDIYGYATTARGARRIANRDFVDPIARIEASEWKPGEPAWLVLTIYGAGLA